MQESLVITSPTGLSSDPSALPIHEVVRLAQKGERGANEAIYSIQKKWLVRLALSRFTDDPVLADQLAHQSLSKALTRIAAIAPKQFRGYLFIALRNEFISYLRSKQTRECFDEKYSGLFANSGSSREPEFVRMVDNFASLERLTVMALKTLPSRAKEMKKILPFFLENFQVHYFPNERDIAERFGYPLKKAHAYRRRAIELIRKQRLL